MWLLHGNQSCTLLKSSHSIDLSSSDLWSNVLCVAFPCPAMFLPFPPIPPKIEKCYSQGSHGSWEFLPKNTRLLNVVIVYWAIRCYRRYKVKRPVLNIEHNMHGRSLPLDRSRFPGAEKNLQKKVSNLDCLICGNRVHLTVAVCCVSLRCSVWVR